jgi:hypothetical protein
MNLHEYFCLKWRLVLFEWSVVRWLVLALIVLTAGWWLLKKIGEVAWHDEH